MSGELRRRLWSLVFTLLVLGTVGFVWLRVAGPPSSPLCPRRPLALGEYIDFVKSLLGGPVDACIGISPSSGGLPVRDVIQAGFLVSAGLGLGAFVVGLVLGGAAALFGAQTPGSVRDRGTALIAGAGVALPAFVLGPALVDVFSLRLGWFPPLGIDAVTAWVLPVVTLSAPLSAYVARLLRAGLVEMSHQPYVRVAWAKGLPARRVLVRHMLRGACVPLVSYLGPAFASLVAGSVVVETLFHIPGLGRAFLAAAQGGDHPLMVGVVLFYGVLFTAVNWIADSISARLDPRSGTLA